MRWLHRFSFRQLLLFAFLLMALLLGAIALQGLHTLERLVAQHRQSLADSVELHTDSRSLADHVITMERAARQYLVLDDQALLQRYRKSADETLAMATRVNQVIGDEDRLPLWQQQRDRIDQLLATPASARDATALTDAFRQLGDLSRDTANHVQTYLEGENQHFLRTLEAGRNTLARQMLAIIGLGLCAALGLGFWLGRPFKRLSQAIAGLGANQLDQPVRIAGPADIETLGRQLDWLRLRLVELDADKTRFLRHISHELKTPLSSLREGISLLEDGVPGPLSADQREIVRILRQHSARLQAQIEELLRFNALAFEARQLRPQSIALDDLIRQQIDEQKLQWQGRRLRLSLALQPVRVEADPDKLALVLANLLSNAIRFSPPDGELLIRLGRRHGQALIDIHDQGPGIAAEDRERIFEPFYCGKVQPDSPVKGSGIGLSVVREYVQAHGGSITLGPDGPGAHFHVEIPHASTT